MNVMADVCEVERVPVAPAGLGEGAIWNRAAQRLHVCRG